MSRGPPSEKAREKALHVASLRGAVYFLQPGREVPADFEIVNTRGVTFISVKMSRRIHCSAPDFERMYRETIAHLLAVPASLAVACELWIISRYGRCRFFRVQPSGLCEVAYVGDSP